MPQPKVKADAIYKGPVGNAAAAGINAPTRLQKISTMEELAVLEPVVDEDRPKLRKPGFSAEVVKPAAFARPSYTAPAPAPAPVAIAAAAAEPEYDEVTEEVTDDEADPNALPEGWTAMADEEGDVFYYNQATAEATWEKPASVKKMKTVVKRIARPVKAAPAKSVVAQPKSAAVSKAAAPAPAPAAAARGPAAGAASGAAKFGGARAAAAPAPAAASGVVADGEPDPEACDAFEPNPFKKSICKKCRKADAKHPQYF